MAHGELQEREAWKSGHDAEASDDLDTGSEAAMSRTRFDSDL
jgi:hypothetical protein